MDIFTQGLLGAVLAQTVAKPDETAKATIVGFAAGLLADTDALIQSTSDPLLYVEYHRHFSHSLVFIPLGALIATSLLWPLMRKHLPFTRIYLYSFMGYSLSGFLDACTSYGTHLFWPLSDSRVAWSIISIIDPIFTLALLIGLLIAWVKHRRQPAQIALAVAGAYLLLGWIQSERAESVVRELAANRGHTIERLRVKPTMGNNLLWRTIYQTGNRYYVDGIRVGLGSRLIYPGSSITKFDPTRDLPSLAADSTLYRDIQRFATFSDGFVALHPVQEHVLGDIRYAMIPTSLNSIWGIVMNPMSPDRHVQFRFYRDMARVEREQFISMLAGRAPAD